MILRLIVLCDGSELLCRLRRQGLGNVSYWQKVNSDWPCSIWMDRVHGWRTSCFGSPVTRTTAKPYVTSSPTGGQSKPTRINLKSNIQVVFYRRLTLFLYGCVHCEQFSQALTRMLTNKDCILLAVEKAQDTPSFFEYAHGTKIVYFSVEKNERSL